MKSSLTFKSGVNSEKHSLNIWTLIWGFLWALLIFILFARIFWLQQVSVIGASMEPNYYTDQLLFVDQLNKNFERGRVVAVYDDKNIAKDANYFTRFQPGVRFLLKRIIALPGESIEIRGSQVIIYNTQYPNGAVLQEDYLPARTKQLMEQQKNPYPKTFVPEGEYFVLGDNRTNSTDSRFKGTFPEYAILGQEFVRAWPLEVARMYWSEKPEYKFTPVT
jgi:signal peptidase I